MEVSAVSTSAMPGDTHYLPVPSLVLAPLSMQCQQKESTSCALEADDPLQS